MLRGVGLSPDAPRIASALHIHCHNAFDKILNARNMFLGTNGLIRKRSEPTRGEADGRRSETVFGRNGKLAQQLPIG
jgi:hypothetical protein